MVLDVDLSDFDRWCHVHLRAGIDDVVFRSGHLSIVVGVRLSSGRRVVVKIRRPFTPTYRRMWQRQASQWSVRLS
jgi:hypothetical protein